MYRVENLLSSRNRPLRPALIFSVAPRQIPTKLTAIPTIPETLGIPGHRMPQSWSTDAYLPKWHSPSKQCSPHFDDRPHPADRRSPISRQQGLDKSRQCCTIFLRMPTPSRTGEQGQQAPRWSGARQCRRQATRDHSVEQRYKDPQQRYQACRKTRWLRR